MGRPRIPQWKLTIGRWGAKAMAVFMHTLMRWQSGAAFIAASVASGCEAILVYRDNPWNLWWITSSYACLTLASMAFIRWGIKREFTKKGAWPPSESLGETLRWIDSMAEKIRPEDAGKKGRRSA